MINCYINGVLGRFPRSLKMLVFMQLGSHALSRGGYLRTLSLHTPPPHHILRLVLVYTISLGVVRDHLAPRQWARVVETTLLQGNGHESR
jgi:hypothetical protein